MANNAAWFCFETREGQDGNQRCQLNIHVHKQKEKPLIFTLRLPSLAVHSEPREGGDHVKSGWYPNLVHYVPQSVEGTQ